MNKEDFRDWCLSFSCQSPNQRPLVMGILNITPDSFYDGGRYADPIKAYEQAQKMIDAGVDIIDIGGESTRPGALPLFLSEELDRVLPLIERLSQSTDICISIDTYKPELMQAAVVAGAGCINDIFALQKPGALTYAATLDIPICLMHMQGQPQSMQHNPLYGEDLKLDLDDFFLQRIQACVSAGIDPHRLILDPGFGFGKTPAHNLQMVKELGYFAHHRRPLMLGVSRKSTIGRLLNQSPEGCLIGGIALSVYAMLEGVALLRTHDVLETKQACRIIQALSMQEVVF